MKIDTQNNTNIILLKNKLFQINKDLNYSIFLSNEYYWKIFKKIENINLKKANEMAYSIFFKFIPNIEKMKFKVIETSKDEYLFFAFDEEFIKEELKLKGFDLNKIIYLSFIQFLDIDNEEYFRIDEEYILENKNNLINLIKNNKMECYQLNLDTVELKEKSINLKINKGKKERKNKDFLFLLFINIFLFLFLTISLFLTNMKTFSIDKAKLDLFSKNNLPQSMIQLNSIETKYKNLYLKQINIRKIFKILEKYKINNFNIEILEFEFNINVINLKYLKNIENDFQENNIIFTTNKNLIKVEL